ncbi:Protein of unknown function [Pyronema omphalodes CBS 100304]|uniref:Uncharacterized protein n=1 Tax=Pyronema omphalodes (strain CBS 100304) TaxID=1076935 RepID=U4KVX1_PYROM|nr:Protein of unknown function [Pyronema omphalodes CBS 100304]
MNMTTSAKCCEASRSFRNRQPFVCNTQKSCVP